MSPWLMAIAFARSRQLMTKTFTANATFVAPSTTTSLETLVGKGSNGSAGSILTAQVMITSLSSPSSGVGNEPAGSYDWSSLQGSGSIAASQINSGGSGIVVGTGALSIYPNGTFKYTTSNVTIGNNVVAGSASVVRSGGWQTSGAISYGQQGNENVSYSYYGPASNGTASTAFGKTFPGGVGGPATAVTYNNVAVTPGASYSIVVPSGGSVTITYYQ